MFLSSRGVLRKMLREKIRANKNNYINKFYFFSSLEEETSARCSLHNKHNKTMQTVNFFILQIKTNKTGKANYSGTIKTVVRTVTWHKCTIFYYSRYLHKVKCKNLIIKTTNNEEAGLNFTSESALSKLSVPFLDPVIGAKLLETLLEVVAGLVLHPLDFLAPVEI